MAEFKLGRIRFVWKNTWAGSTTYIKDDVVRFGGKTYVCILGHTSTSNFYTDLTANWNLASDGQVWLGTWAGTTTYKIGDTVKYGGLVYICNLGHTSQATLEADSAKWDTFASAFDWKDAWAITTVYKIGDIVKYGATIYRCKLGHTSAGTLASGLELDQSKWDVLNQSFDYKGTFATTTRYKNNDVVKWGAGLWICTAYHTSTSTFDDAKWSQFVEGLEFEDTWSSSTAYQAGDIVTYGGYTYAAISNHTNQTPSTATAYWSLFSTGFLFSGDWTTSTAYKVGNVVRLGGYTYLATADHTAGGGNKPANTSFWQQLNPGFKWLGSWTTSTGYILGDTIKYNNNSYVCILPHTAITGNRPDNDVSSTYWNLLTGGVETAVMTTQGDITYYGGSGPARLPIGTDGQVLRVTGSNLTWDTFGDINNVYYVAPTGTDAAGYGGTLDKPFLTIKYACQVANTGTAYTNANTLIANNITWLPRELAQYQVYAKANSLDGFTPSSVFDAAKSFRDSNFVIDAIRQDMTRNSNQQTVIAALSYFSGPTTFYNAATTASMPYIITSLNKLRDLMIAAVTKTAPANNYQTLTSYTPAIAFSSTGTAAEANASATITNLMAIITNALTAVSTAGIPTPTTGAFTSIFIKTGTYSEVLPISIPENTALIGDELRGTVVQPASGYTTSNMFYVRNGSGIRNMTLQGLSGTLGAANAYGTQRPTAGAYVSLDPGTGVNDASVWIFRRSPYIQNVTTFGSGCIGMKIDGSLHSGGNKSIVANDFTQILSDGIGIWVTNLARSELVSVFTYYCHIGYLSENGGKIRATNGNNSYGKFGSVSEGVDSSETPITATVNNRALQAIVGNTFTSGNSIFRVEYTNAGTSYANTGTAYTFNSPSGINAAVIGDEVRDNAVFENRMLTSGTGYVNVVNVAQAGTVTTVTIAAADTAVSLAYLGMRILITSGVGVGQTAYFTYYSSGTKGGIIAKESFTTITASAVTASGALITVPSTVTFYVGMPVTFTGTTIGGFALATVYYVATIDSINNKIGISASSGGAVISSGLTDASGSTMIIHAAGWDHVVPGTAIVAGLDSTTTYSIEPRVQFTAGTFTTTSRTMPSTAKQWTSAAYGAGNGRFVAVATGTNASATSIDGFNWIAGGTIPGGTTWVSIASGAISSTTYHVTIAGGTGSTTSAYSTSGGDTWSAMGSLPAGNWTSVAFGNGRFVAVSNGTVSAFSTTGTGWVNGGGLVSANYVSIAYGSGPAKFVAIAGGSTGTSQATAYSADGVSWSAGTLPALAYWTSITYGNGRFVAVAQGSTATAYSLDGITWTTPATVLPQVSAWSNIKYGQGTFLATAGKLTPTFAATTPGSNLVSLSSTAGLATGQTIVPTVATVSTTTTNANRALTVLSGTSRIDANGILSPGLIQSGSSLAVGMVLSGSGITTAQNIAITAMSGNSTVVTVSYVTQKTIPFVTGQTIKIVGAIPVGYNGSWVVTGTPTTGQVQFTSSLVTTVTTFGFVQSTPTFITGTTAFTSTASSISSTTLTVGGTVTGTVALGQAISGLTYTSNFQQIIGTALSISGATVGTPTNGMYIGGPGVATGTTITAAATGSWFAGVAKSTDVTFTGSISGNILTVTAVPSGTGLNIGMVLSISTLDPTKNSIIGGTYITANLTGTSTSASSTWTVNLPQTLASTANIVANAVVMTVSAVGSGSVVPGAVLTGPTTIPVPQAININSVVTDGLEVRLNYTTTGTAAFAVGQRIDVTGTSVSAYNTTWVVSACTATFVRFYSALNTDIGSAGGVITSSGTFVTAQATSSVAPVVSPTLTATAGFGVAGFNQFVVSSATSIAIGQLVTGTGIPTNTYVTSIASTTITLSNNFITDGSGTYNFYAAGGAGTYYITPATTAAIAGGTTFSGLSYTLSISHNISQTNTIFGNSLTGYITAFVGGSGGAGTYTVSTSFAPTGTLAISGVNYQTNTALAVAATAITGTNNTINVASSTGLTVGQNITFSGGTAARTPAIQQTASSGNLITLSSGTGVVQGNVIIPTATIVNTTATQTASGSNQLLLASATGITAGASLILTAVSQSTTATATTNATASLTTSTMDTLGVLTVGAGTPVVGMVLTGTGVQTAQSIPVTVSAGTGSVVTLTYATQGSVPFIAGQTITVRGMTPTAYNGTWTVTGTPTTTQVTFNSTATGALTTTGTIISEPCYVVSNITGSLWQTNLSATVAVASTTITGTNNIITVASTTGMTVGAMVQFAGAVAGNIVAGTTYYITQVVNATTIAISATFKGANFAVTTTTSQSFTLNVGASFGNLMPGDVANAVYYVTAVTGNYVKLSVNPTLTPELPLVNANGAWTVRTGDILGGAATTIVETASGGNWARLSNSVSATVGQVITPVTDSVSVTVGSTLGAQTTSMTTSTISTAGVLTSVAGAPFPGMILTGTNIPIAQNYAVTATSGNGTTATITFASATAPIVGQLVTIQGVTPVGYNGTFVVTGSSATTVQYANTTTGSMITSGSMISKPTYVVSNINGITGAGGTWQVNYTTGPNVTSTTIGGAANLMAVSSVRHIQDGQQFTTPASGTFGGLSNSTTYYVTATIPSTNQVAISTTYFGAAQAFTSGTTVGSFVGTFGSGFGGLISGTPYYVAVVSASGNYVRLSTSATLTPIATLTNGNDAWTTGIDDKFGLVSGRPYYVASIAGANITVSASPTLTPVITLQNGGSSSNNQWTTAVSDTSTGSLPTSLSASFNYYITGIISSTNQLIVSTTYLGNSIDVVNGTGGTVTTVAGSYLGGITSGVTYYIATVDPVNNQVTLSTSATLTPIVQLAGLSLGAWTSVSGAGAAASSPDGINWTTRALTNDSWAALVFGNTATSFTASITTTTLTVTSAPSGSGIVVGQTLNGIGITAGTTVVANLTGTATSSSSTWTVSTNYATTTGSKTITAALPTWVAIAGGSVTSTNAVSIPNFTTAQARAVIASGQIASFRIVEPGSGYTTSPSVTITDPNATSAATFTVRTGIGALGNPSYTNRGTGYTTATTNVSGVGFADIYQTTQYINVSGMSLVPTPGANVQFAGNANYYKLVSVSSLSGSAGNYSAALQLSPTMTISLSPVHGVAITMRILYSQCRLTGHDFLSIGTGNFATTNYPNTPSQVADPLNETVENNGGRVFYTSTDQDGNFNVGDLFTVQQSTGIATLNANAFNLSGLQTLTLGAVTLGSSNTSITSFSTDGTFTANSDNIVPTQRAIRTFIASQIGGGGSTVNVNTLVAGNLQITGNVISNTTGSAINIKNRANFTQGVDGSPLALNYFLLR
jgi:hypothetical protein